MGTPEPEAAPAASGGQTARELIGRFVPITAWSTSYPRAWLGKDIVSGITSWAVMVPVAMAYAELAGVPAGVGLITATAGLTAYAVLGTGRHVKVTTSSTMAVMSASVVASAADGDPARYLALTAALAIIVGLMLLGAGLLRLGFLSEFLAKPVITGFLVGLAVTIIVGQLPKLFGVSGSDGNVIDQLIGLSARLNQANLVALAIGIASMILILVTRAVDRRIPGPLIAVALAIVAVTVFDLVDEGVAIVGAIETSLPRPALPQVDFSDIAFLVTGAAGIVFLALAESISAGRAFATRHGYRIDPDQELVALGGANATSGFFGGFAVDASVSSMATGEAAGNKTQLSSLVMAALLLLTILVLAPLFTNLPQSVLAAVIVTSVIGVVDLPEWRRYIAWRRTDALLAAVAAIGVMATDVLTGLAIAALFSVLILLYRASRPAIAVLGRLSGPDGTFVDVARHEQAETIDGLLLIRLDTPLYYFNASAVAAAVLDRTRAAIPPPRAVLLDVAATDELDVTTSDMLHDLIASLEERAVALVIVHAKGNVRDRMARVGLIDRLGPTGMYPTEEVATRALVAIFERSEADPDEVDSDLETEHD